MRTDEELALASTNGDDDAFDELTKRYLAHIYNFVRRYGGKEDAADITQETFLKAWKHIKRFKEGASFKTWLFAIARNTAFDRLRKRKPSLFSDFDPQEEGFFEETIPDSELLEELFERKEEIELLERGLLTLAPDDRAILLFHYHDEFTFEEIARILKKPMNTVKSRHRRALLKLRDFLNAPKPAPERIHQ